MEFQKHCVGIDISRLTFTACICSKLLNQDVKFSEVRTFSNDKKGFNQLNRWVVKELEDTSVLVYLMEATGVYYEKLAYHLFKIKKSVHVVLPNKTKHYFASLNVKSKTDEQDAKVLSQFGVERNHFVWNPPHPIYLELRNLTRYHHQLQTQRTSLSNIKHSKEESYSVQSFVLKSNKMLIKSIDKQIASCKKEIERLVNSDAELKEKANNILSMKGVGLLTVATIIAENLGFEQFHNVKQLVSYAGFDIVQRESGTSIKGKSRISKKVNKYIRNALYFPALVACRYNENLKNTYLEIVKRKPSKMIGVVAIQRKLLILVYTLWNKNESYQDDYKSKVAPTKAEATRDNS